MIGIDIALLIGEKAAAEQPALPPDVVLRYGKHASIVKRPGASPPSSDIVVKKDGFDYRVFNDMSNDYAYGEAMKLYRELERGDVL